MSKYVPFWHSKSLPTFLHEDNRAKYSNARLPNALKDCPLFSTYVHFLMEFSPISGRGPTPNLFLAILQIFSESWRHFLLRKSYFSEILYNYPIVSNLKILKRKQVFTLNPFIRDECSNDITTTTTKDYYERILYAAFNRSNSKSFFFCAKH